MLSLFKRIVNKTDFLLTFMIENDLIHHAEDRGGRGRHEEPRRLLGPGAVPHCIIITTSDAFSEFVLAVFVHSLMSHAHTSALSLVDEIPDCEF